MSESSFPTQQKSLFGDASTPHELVERRGRTTALKEASLARPTPGTGMPRFETEDTPLLMRMRRGGRVLSIAADYMGEEAQLAERAGYTFSGWCHAGLPHRQRLSPDDVWLLNTGFASLTVEPGRRMDGDGNSVFIGVPWGAHARLILLDWQSEAQLTGSRTLHLGPSLNSYVARLGITKSESAFASVSDQLERLARCRVTFEVSGNAHGSIQQQLLVDDFDYVDEGARLKRRRFINQITLSQRFYDQITRFPVIYDRAAIGEIGNASMALDIYLWCCLRLPWVTKPTPVSWSALKAQFGSSVGTMRNFKPQFRENLAVALAVYRGARVDETQSGIVLIPSPRPVSRTPIPAT